jgi:hypothetical protein
MKGLGVIVAALALAAGVVFVLVEETMRLERTERVRKGDLVQWESNGSYMFETPRKVTNIVNSVWGMFAYVDGSPTGIPVEQLIVVGA